MVGKLIAVEKLPLNNDHRRAIFKKHLCEWNVLLGVCPLAINARVANGMSWCLPLGVAFLDKKAERKIFYNKNIYSLVIILSMTATTNQRSFHLRSRPDMWDVYEKNEKHFSRVRRREEKVSPKVKWVRCGIIKCRLQFFVSIMEKKARSGTNINNPNWITQ